METSLPQNQDTKNRNDQLRESRRQYQWRYDYEALPGVPMADGIPEGELPPVDWIAPVAEKGITLIINNLLNDDKPGRPGFFHRLLKLRVFQLRKLWTLGKRVEKIILKPEDILNSLTNLATEFSVSEKAYRPKDLKDYDELYKEIKKPNVAKTFKKDDTFALMRVAGQNPVILQGILNVDNQFPVTDKMLKKVSGFKNDSLQKAGADGRLFIADYALLRDLKDSNSGNGEKYGHVPKALFAVPAIKSSNPMKSLVPIAIQTEQAPSPTNLFTPSDGYAWMIAKTIVQTADFSHHELVTHLTQTHLQIERFCVATHRRLAQNHPLNCLLLPHFQGTIFINFGAQLALVNDGGVFSELFYGTMETNRKLVGEVLNWNFNDAIFPRRLKRQKVESIPYYPYRDDGLKIWEATAKWVSDYLSIYYGTDPEQQRLAIEADTELAAWVTELQSSNGGRLQGFGEESGKIETFAYLVEAVTSIIFTASAQHAAVNFPQSKFSGYPPNMPAALYQPIPVGNKARFQDWLDQLPPLNMAESQILVTHILTATIHGELGKYKTTAFSDKRVKPVLKAYQMALKKVDSEIARRIKKDKRNGAKLDYDYLRLKNIPQSINI